MSKEPFSIDPEIKTLRARVILQAEVKAGPTTQMMTIEHADMNDMIDITKYREFVSKLHLLFAEYGDQIPF